MDDGVQVYPSFSFDEYVWCFLCKETFWLLFNFNEETAKLL